MAQPAQTAAPQHLIPQSLQIEQKETLEQISMLARRKGPVGVAAGKALVLFKKHIAREQEFILPPLTLLPLLAEGKVTPDMAWALPMTDRVKAEREQIFDEHTEITEALNQLVVAAAVAHDNDAKEFAESAAAESLNDLEILQPTLLLIGDILHSKLPAGH
ncbi:MAG: hypothetical protein P4L90_28430 [Rhodopila sp.]|nr:hypothetical protein [Rhodopila sp.]